MAIDPRIPLGVTPMQITPPMEQAARALQMKGAMQSVQAGDLDLQQKQEAMRQQQAELDLFRNNPKATPEDLARVAGGQKAVAYGKGLAEQQKAELEAARGRVGLTAQLLQGVTPANFALAKQGIAAMLGPEAAAQLGESYDETLVKSLVNRALETKDWIELQFKDDENKRDQETHDASLPGVQADSTKKQAEAVAAELSTFAQQFQATTDQAGWDAVYATLPEPLKKNFHPKRSAGSIRSAQHVGMKADEVLAANVAQQRANIDAAQAGETARHNRVMESRQSEPLEAIIGPDGKPVMVPRSQAIGKMPATNRDRPTEDERKTAGFYKQMRDAITTLDEVEAQLTEKELYQIQTLPQDALIGMANRNQMSEAAKRYLRAFEQFTEARLRPVSGAAISDSEFARDRRTYARQYSETPTLNADRRRAREGALDSLRTRAGVLAPKAEEVNEGPQEGAEQPIPGVPGGVAKFQGGKWVRIK